MVTLKKNLLFVAVLASMLSVGSSVKAGGTGAVSQEQMTPKEICERQCGPLNFNDIDCVKNCMKNITNQIKK